VFERAALNAGEDGRVEQLREWDYKRMREIADKVGALLLIDMAHTAGLIAAGLLDNPVKYAHIVTSTGTRRR